jgi:hypothetical protein
MAKRPVPTNNKWKQYLNSINNSKLLAGLAMILVNIGSKYIEIKFTNFQEQYLRNSIGREIIIFALAFMATHDIVISILITAAFIILANYAFNEKSNLCVIPKKYRQLNKVLDKNKDGNVSQTEINKAIAILNKAKY